MTIDVDCGGGRCGVECGGDYVEFAYYQMGMMFNSVVKFCGQNKPPVFHQPYLESFDLSDTNSSIHHVLIVVNFVTDYLTERSGFMFRWGPIGESV